MIKKEQVVGLKRANWKEEKIKGHIPLFFSDTRRLLIQCGRVWVPVVAEVRQTLLGEAHKLKILIHAGGGGTKMYRDLRLSYRWPCMKKEIAWYFERCLNCRKVKAEHHRPHGKIRFYLFPCGNEKRSLWNL